MQQSEDPFEGRVTFLSDDEEVERAVSKMADGYYFGIVPYHIKVLAEWANRQIASRELSKLVKRYPIYEDLPYER